APDSQQESSPLSGRKSTQATVRICGASSLIVNLAKVVQFFFVARPPKAKLDRDRFDDGF
ncbi:hypothetical protein, partial [Bradyrhizobium liaoningense]